MPTPKTPSIREPADETRQCVSGPFGHGERRPAPAQPPTAPQAQNWLAAMTMLDGAGTDKLETCVNCGGWVRKGSPGEGGHDCPTCEVPF